MHSATPDLLQTGEFLCPACNARQEISDTCRRCRADLTLLRRTAQAWRSHRRRCLNALSANQRDAALHAAEQCDALFPSRETARLLALCQLLRRDFPAALASRRRARSEL
jgi:hypothetical protein